MLIGAPDPSAGDKNRLLPQPKRMLPLGKVQSAKQPAAKPAPSKFLYHGPLESMQRLSVPIHHESLAAQVRHGFTGFTPAQQAAAARMYRQNVSGGILTRIGNHVQQDLGLRKFGKQTTQMFDPRTKSGVANIASLFAGGPEDLGAEGSANATDLLNREMPGQFRVHSIPQERVLGNIVDQEKLGQVYHPSGSMFEVKALIRASKDHPDPAVRASALRLLHDHFFGGEVHARGSIPPQP